MTAIDEERALVERAQTDPVGFAKSLLEPAVQSNYASGVPIGVVEAVVGGLLAEIQQEYREARLQAFKDAGYHLSEAAQLEADKNVARAFELFSHNMVFLAQKEFHEPPETGGEQA